MEIHVIWGLFIPVLFLVFTGLIKSLVRKSVNWSNFYLGLDIALAALANGVVNIVEEVHASESLPGGYPPEFGQQMFYSAIFIAASVGCLLTVMTIHQTLEDPLDGEKANQKIMRGIWLGGVANLLGSGLLFSFIYLKLRRLV